jgi:hypothetical protein
LLEEVVLILLEVVLVDIENLQQTVNPGTVIYSYSRRWWSRYNLQELKEIVVVILQFQEQV